MIEVIDLTEFMFEKGQKAMTRVRKIKTRPDNKDKNLAYVLVFVLALVIMDMRG